MRSLWSKLIQWLSPSPELRELGVPVPPSPEDAEPPPSADAVSALPLDGELDLHTFQPREVGPLVRDYVAACRSVGVLQLRIVHGKGKGALRRTVHAQLQRDPAVAHFALAPPERGGWGATLVDLHPLAQDAREDGQR